MRTQRPQHQSRRRTLLVSTVLCICTHALLAHAWSPCDVRVLEQSNPYLRTVVEDGVECTRRRVWLSIFDAVGDTNACEYVHEGLVLDACVTQARNKEPSRTFSVAFTSARETGTCVGPYVTNGQDGTTLTAIEAVQFPMPGCKGANCTEVALVFGFSFGSTDKQCHHSSLFGIYNFTYALATSNNDTFTMTWCNGTECQGPDECATLFTELPLNECRDNSWGSMMGHVELVETQSLITCSSSHPLVPTATLIGVFVGLCAAIVVLVLGIWQYRNLKRRRGYMMVQ
ncbi:hypothetical protein PTSG_07480 [Salpingoeca rosetta]|uniref:Membrane-associated protein n=1 Tax=Salpingoeca rosetta (strain ATCC 50818 / BSB-021) TaxID=946362 RepID=F2UIU7_SALR5|nr:uncharacterized protein PTSG_07480 [Salpingoeca rosetta]EGD77146.1 hypothetical protein PTSG_07480 [Salpingoeca rosetta]|eukprot:XP_004990985.1 hypothetical protein PTSG_07480 [Salpingoeca rosetta]